MIWLLTLDTFDALDRPLGIFDNITSLTEALDTLTNSQLKKEFQSGLENVLIYRLPLNDMTDTRELWTVDAVYNEQRDTHSSTTVIRFQLAPRLIMIVY